MTVNVGKKSTLDLKIATPSTATTTTSVDNNLQRNAEENGVCPRQLTITRFSCQLFRREWSWTTSYQKNWRLLLEHLKQGCTTQVHWRAKKNLMFKGQILWVFTYTKDVFMKKASKKKKLGFCGPYLARRPYVVHACCHMLFI